MSAKSLKAGSAVSALVLFGLWTSAAHATFHLWKIDEVYSNASGSIQFIEPGAITIAASCTLVGLIRRRRRAS